MRARLLLDDVERGVEGVLVGERTGGIGRVDVEGHVVRREHGHARRRCHGSGKDPAPGFVHLLILKIGNLELECLLLILGGVFKLGLY